MHATDDRSTVLVPADPWSESGDLGAASPPPIPGRLATRPRTREEIDVALHGIGLAIEDLLDGVRLHETADVTTELAGPPPVPDLQLRLCELIAEADVDARRIEVAIDGPRVTLRGAVDDPLSRLLIEDLAWSLPDVLECDNHLAVVAAP